MAISPINPSSAYVSAPQPVRPSQPTEAAQQAKREERTDNSQDVKSPPPPKPSVDANGNPLGTILNITA